MSASGYAVLDVETTGLFPQMNDRVIEVAVVHVDADGAITGRWDTLVNPSRDLGPQHIHGIRAADILEAPSFAEIAPGLLELLRGRTLVAHNAAFDLRFLLAEFERAGYPLWGELEPLCTMRLARDFLPGSGRSLADCCDACGIELAGAHRALVDATATAELLGIYLASSSDRALWNAWLARGAAFAWPALPEAVRASLGSTRWHPRPDTPAGDLTAAVFLERISVKLPEFGGPVEQLEYLALLDRCLLDRHLSVAEGRALIALAEESGISRSTCAELHRDYFDDLARVAWSDGVLEATELADLAEVAVLLAVDAEVVAAALDPAGELALSAIAAAAGPGAAAREAGLGAAAGASAELVFRLALGDLIVLTGAMSRPRDDWHAELTSRGFVPGAAVSKKVRLVVAADPDSLSGKARKARDYGIPVVNEAGLARLLGEFA